MLTEKVDNERMLRQAESYYIDSNMLQNRPKFVSYIFSQNALAFPSLISPLKVKKSPLAIFTVSPAVAATVQDVKPVLGMAFDNEKAVAPDLAIIPVTPDISEKVAAPSHPVLPDPHEEEWLSSSQQDPDNEKHSLLDF